MIGLTKPSQSRLPSLIPDCALTFLSILIGGLAGAQIRESVLGVLGVLRGSVELYGFGSLRRDKEGSRIFDLCDTLLQARVRGGARGHGLLVCPIFQGEDDSSSRGTSFVCHSALTLAGVVLVLGLCPRNHPLLRWQGCAWRGDAQPVETSLPSGQGVESTRIEFPCLPLSAYLYSLLYVGSRNIRAYIWWNGRCAST